MSLTSRCENSGISGTRSTLTEQTIIVWCDIIKRGLSPFYFLIKTMIVSILVANFTKRVLAVGQLLT